MTITLGGLGIADEASEVAFTPAGGVSATTLQLAVQELDTEKSPTSHAHAGVYAPSGITTIASSGASQTVNVGAISDVDITWTASTVVAFSNWPAGAHAIVMHWTMGGAGNFAPTFTGVTWDDGELPIFDPTVGAKGFVIIESTDGGATVTGIHGQSKLIRSHIFYVPVGIDLGVKTDANCVQLRRPSRIIGVLANCRVAPTGAAILVDLNLGSTPDTISTIWTTQGNRATIPVSSKVANSGALITNMNVKTVPAGSYMNMNIDQVGSTIKGQGLTVQVFYMEG